MKCSAEICSDDYIGESARRIMDRVKDHDGQDTKSHVLKHSSEKEHVEVTQGDFKSSAVISHQTQQEDCWGIINKTEAPLFQCPRSISWAKIAQLMSFN